MFDFAWSEIALIGVVALVLIGPKDLPIAIKAITSTIKKARRMAAEFQTHVDDMVKDADLGEVREQFRELRSMDIRGAISRAVDSDGSLREAFRDPMRSPPPVTPTIEATTTEATGVEATGVETPAVDTSAPFTEVTVEARPVHTFDVPPPSVEAPAFIPPANARPPVPPPSFIPPGTKRPEHLG